MLILFPHPEMLVIERLICRGVDEPPSAMRPKFFLTFVDRDGGRAIVWDGLTHYGALEAAENWGAGVRLVDRTENDGGAN